MVNNAQAKKDLPKNMEAVPPNELPIKQSRKQVFFAKLKKAPKYILKFFLILFILCILVGVGFAIGIYLKFIDPQKIANEWQLSKYPIIGKYIPKSPQTNFEPLEPAESEATLPPPPPAAPVIVPPGAVVQPVPSPSINPTTTQQLTPEEASRQLKMRQQEEAKRIGKLARLYGGMKPEEAAPIIKNLDDETIIAILGKMEEEQASKVLSAIDPARAAQLTRTMLHPPLPIAATANQ